MTLYYLNPNFEKKIENKIKRKIKRNLDPNFISLTIYFSNVKHSSYLVI